MPDLDIYVESVKHFRKSQHVYILGQVLLRLKQTDLSYRIIDSFDVNDTWNCAFLHVDLTELPQPFRQVHAAYPCSINGEATTINRNIYSRSILNHGDSYQGPVIVKTLLNHRGLPELRYSKNRNLASLIRYRFRRVFDYNYKERLCPPYAIYNSLKEVSADTWKNPRLIVEKFLPGNLELPVTKNRYDFFFDSTFNTRAVFDSLFCDPAKVIKVEIVSEVPEEVMNLRKKLNLDFGSIDYFMLDGQAIVIDVNKTTTTTAGWIDKFPPLDQYLNEITERLVGFIKAN